MSPYRYRCGQCRASSPPTHHRAGAEAHRAHHRATVHGDLVPDQERIDHVRGAAGQDPDVRYVSGGTVLVVLALLALASLISRVLGR